MGVVFRKVSLAFFAFAILASFGKSAAEQPPVAVLDSALTRKFVPNPVFYDWEMDGSIQALKNLMVSFARIHDEDLTPAGLKIYKILVLPGTKNISRDHIEAIREFVKHGGKLFALGFASYRDEQDQSPTLHNNFQLADLIGADYLRLSPIPPHAGFIQLGSGDQIATGRNTSIQIHPHPGTRVLGTWIDDDGITASAPRGLDAAIVETSNAIYVGENLFAPENSHSVHIQDLIANLLDRLEPNIAHAPENEFEGYPNLPEFGEPAPLGEKSPPINVGLPYVPDDGYVTSSGAFRVLDRKGHLVVYARKNWRVAFHGRENGFDVAGKLGPKFSFVPYHSTAPLEIVMWHGAEGPASPFKFAAFRGSLTLMQSDGKKILVNRLPLEAYLAGVVSHEVPFYFHAGALRAMAVVARTVALSDLQSKKFPDYDICATVSCQAYDGLAYESPSAREAVEETAGKAVTYDGHLASVPYAATCGGVSENIEDVWKENPVPYLRSVVDGETPISENLATDEGVRKFLNDSADSFCRFSSRFRWKETYSRTELEGLFKTSLPVILKHPVNFSSLVDLNTTGRTPHGRATGLKIQTNGGDFTVGKDQIRWLFSGGHIGLGGLQSTLFVIDKEKDPDGNLQSVTFVGGGWGHGVGMCQFGAEGMARLGYTYEQILSHYFPGTSVR